MSFRVSIIQSNISFMMPKENRQRMSRLIGETVKKSPDLIVLPETWTTGFHKKVFNNSLILAETETGPTINLMKNLAFNYSVWICAGTILEKDSDKVYNTMYLINPKGKIHGKYRKIQLYNPGYEGEGITPSNYLEMFKTELGLFAPVICYELRFPEIMREYAKKGAKVILLVANFQKPKYNLWKTILRARAIENEIFVIACNRVGNAEENLYFGHSLIIDPLGEIIAEGKDVEEIITQDINISLVDKIRSNYSVFNDMIEFKFKD